MESVDHDLLIRIKQALESFIKEVESQFKLSDTNRAEMCSDINKIKEDNSKMKERIAIMENDLCHFRKDIEDAEKRIDKGLTDNKTYIDGIKNDTTTAINGIKTDTTKAIDDNKRTLGEWIAIAGIIVGIICTVIGFFIPH